MAHRLQQPTIRERLRQAHVRTTEYLEDIRPLLGIAAGTIAVASAFAIGSNDQEPPRQQQFPTELYIDRGPQESKLPLRSPDNPPLPEVSEYEPSSQLT